MTDIYTHSDLDHSVLVVEPKHSLASIIERELKSTGINIIPECAKSLSEAEECVKKKDYELILLRLDEQVPFYEQLDSIEKIVSAGHKGRVLLVDYDTSNNMKELALNAGVADYVDSPMAFPAGFRNRVKERLDLQGYQVDQVTKLPGKTLFIEKLKETYDKVTSLHQRNIKGSAQGEDMYLGLSLVFIDLDGFKPVNDKYGHNAGDRVLKQIGATFSKKEEGAVLRSSADIAARFGGDEFVIMLESKTIEDAKKVAKRICSAISEHDYSENVPECKEYLKIGMSYGIVSYIAPSTEEGFKEYRAKNNYITLINEADKAMYSAKQRRKLESGAGER
jgi:diguanylate cyclase (GGDEF)-like protein